MKKLKLILCLMLITVLLSACGVEEKYTCYKCGTTTSKAYYDLNATKDDVLCEDCARSYWMPFPYENYRVK